MKNPIIENSLFRNDLSRFQEIKKCVKEFNTSYNGHNIIQDDIFHIACNYAARNGMHLELFRIPVQDDNFCAFTCIRECQLFTVLNSSLPVSKQIFAMSHELYHIWCYITDQDASLPHSGSLLTADEMDELKTTREDTEANAFAALLLVPASAMNEQIEIYNIDKKKIDIAAVVRLMDIFAVPFKAMVLRLYEEGMLSERAADSLIQEGITDNIALSMAQQNISARWQRRTPEIVDFGRLPMLLKANRDAGRLPDQRLDEDEKFLEEMYTWFSGK